MNGFKMIVLQGWSFPLIASGVFFMLALLTHNGYTLRFDQNVLTWFHHHRTPWLDIYFSTITWMGSLWILLPIYILYMIFYGTAHPSVAKLFTILFWGSVMTTYTIKYLLERKRPHFFTPLNELPIDPSFPSAHSAQIAAMTIALGITLLSSDSGVHSGMVAALVFIALSVFISRIYLQVHFPTDVIGGILIAFIWTGIALWIMNSGVQQ